MLTVSPKHRIFLAIAHIDFRKGIDAISRLCLQQFNLDPKVGHYFVFRNRRKTDIKILYYDSQGFCLFQKRLSAGKFNFWPQSYQQQQTVSLSPAQLQVLLSNGDPQNTNEMPPWRPIAS